MNTRTRGFIVLMVATLVVISTLAAVHETTRDRVNANRARELWRHAETLTGIDDLHQRGTPPAAGSAISLNDGHRLLFGSVEGYGGSIDFLVLLASTHHIAGLRVTRHQETPGIGDFIDQPESEWMRQFIGADATSLNDIDGKTGATITTRALSRAVQELVSHTGDQP
jgi:Na+-translocating ferredoxin:NAD+ oxidoreductase RnfG subunit